MTVDNICGKCRNSAVGTLFGGRTHVVRCPYKSNLRKRCGIPKTVREAGVNSIRIHILSMAL